MKVLKETPIDGLYLTDYKFVVDTNKLKLCKSSDLLDLSELPTYVDIDTLDLVKNECDLGESYTIEVKCRYTHIASYRVGYIFVYKCVIFIWDIDRHFKFNETSLLNAYNCVFESLNNVVSDTSEIFKVFLYLLELQKISELIKLDNGNYFFDQHSIDIGIEFNNDFSIYNIFAKADIYVNDSYVFVVKICTNSFHNLYILTKDKKLINIGVNLESPYKVSDAFSFEYNIYWDDLIKHYVLATEYVNNLNGGVYYKTKKVLSSKLNIELAKIIN